jgi:hypothetical protein
LLESEVFPCLIHPFNDGITTKALFPYEPRIRNGVFAFKFTVLPTFQPGRTNIYDFGRILQEERFAGFSLKKS